MSLRVRAAEPGDAALIHALVRELAEYERLADAVAATEADMARDLFGAAPRVFSDIVELDGEPAGFSLWFYAYSSFAGRHGIYLEDLFVRPRARGLGAGKALLRALARRCADEGLGRLEWAVLDWNAPAIGFYDKLGADEMSGWTVRRLCGDALARLAAS